jgi:hypothetical protein
MSGWLLQGIAIEGMRGINNEGDPLAIRFKPDCVTSISAPNGVGKSSIFDALSFAIRGRIQKLDELPASENATTYYVNRFHSVGQGQIALTLIPDGGGSPVAIKVVCGADGSRTVTGPSGVDAEVILSQLDREFVLLDNTTFQSFIDNKDLDRGRAFAGLLGLKRYSELRQTFQGLARTQPFNNHFDVRAIETRQRQLAANTQAANRSASMAFTALAKKRLDEFQTRAGASAAAHAALEQVALLKSHCTGKSFEQIDFQACLDDIKHAERGEERAALAALIAEQNTLEAKLQADGLVDGDKDALRVLAAKRDDELKQIGSALLHQHFVAARAVLAEDSWPNKNLCPTCETENRDSVLVKVDDNLRHYQSVVALAGEISTLWETRGFNKLVFIEENALEEGEPSLIADIARALEDHSLGAAQVDVLWGSRATCRARLEAKLERIKADRLALEQKLPESYVEVSTNVEAAKRLAENWAATATAERELTALNVKKARIDKVKRFLDGVSAIYSGVESRTAARRLAAVEPICRSTFGSIVHSPVQPALVKPAGGEELALSLSQFWTLQNVSAQALLAESFRNALAISVYLAAAQLYGGDARFIVLDDVTSSFDAGHQFHVMEIIRTRFARPGNPTGPQVVILSHDTLLEKLFNRNSNGPTWQHIRLEGTARTAVLPQTGATSRVRDATVSLLSAGQVQEGALRLRPYLEYKLLEIIGRVSIPVPVDFAMDDNRKQVQNCIDAIQAAINLHRAANSLILTATQQAGLQTHMATIAGNYLSHYATGSTQAFSGPALLGVVSAIDAYAECFMYEDPPGQQRYYRSLSQR